MAGNEDKKKALDAAIATDREAVWQGYGDEAGRPGAQMQVETVPTGSLSLDIALGLGGVPKGRIDRDLRAGVQR